ncbi:FecR family protein [Acetobacter okinawensis]|uniref:FecR family protein n=1 Tax=Acetobacter okinawensis TaxID=1076594 RepID=UPI00209CBF5B|nr:DUF4880 domain-containing protein [Acetobacter okinawensis]MCP1213932.1 DUF4880 domain-containing protein [Acetobacter okinawensis]
MRRDARVSPTLANASPDEAAAGWTARLDKGPLSAGEQQALQHWLEQDVRHKGAFLRAKAIWHASGRLAALQGPTAPAVAHPATLPALPRRRFFAAAAATVALLAVPKRQGKANSLYTTANALSAPLSTAFGTITLDCYSKLKMGLESSRLVSGRCCVMGRTGMIMKAGELIFAPQGRLLLSCTPSQVVATAVSGTVRLRLHHTDEWWTLRAGAQITQNGTQAPEMRSLMPEELDAQNAWSLGQLEVHDESMASIASTFNRYNQRQVHVSPALASHRLTGVFTLTRPEEFAATARTILGARLAETPQTLSLY